MDFLLFSCPLFRGNLNFSQLNDKEFENLSMDLLSVTFGMRIERIKPGKDAGVDGA